jgi:hypothetical protein
MLYLNFRVMKRFFKSNICRLFVLCSIFGYFISMLTCCSSDKDIKIGQENAVWTESLFLRGFLPSSNKRLTDNDLLVYAETLKKYNIKYAYLFAGPFDKEGYLPEYAFSEIAINSVKVLKKLYPEIIILPWVGGIQDKTVHLEDSIWVRNALSDSKRLIQTLSVPGLHFDFEFILKGNVFLDKAEFREGSSDEESYGNNVNEFHRKFRELMPEAFISSVVVATSPGTKPWKRKTTMAELKGLIKYINQLSFLYYDTNINNQSEFQENCLFLLRDIQKLRYADSYSKVQYLVALGTFINVPELQKYRNLDIENIPNTLQTLKDCLFQIAPNEQIVDGISIYCNWETNKTQWNQISRYWTKRNH